MLGHLRANLWLLVLTVVICAVLYPLALLGVGRTVFRQQAQGSLVAGADGKPLGSRLIAQPFTAAEYFQPRPSAASYNGAASGASNWGANNPALRDRVARQLGPIVKYQSGPKKGQPVAADVESWFRGKPGLVAAWAEAHPGFAAAWVKADKLNAEYVTAWRNAHKAEAEPWIRDNPDNPDPKPEDLAAVFFRSFSATHPGAFPDAVEAKAPDGKAEKRIEPVKEGAAIQAVFFDMWRQEHPNADLEPVPADLVMASGSGLDPHITLKGALYQLDRVAAAWAEKTKRDPGSLRKEIEQVLNEQSEAPLGGLAGVRLVNVLEVNLALKDRYGSPSRAQR